MNVYEAMAARQTIRDFSSKDIPLPLIHQIIAAGFHAPSNNHMREWHFILLQDRAQRKALFDQIITPIGKNGAVDIVNHWGLTDEAQRKMYIDAIPKQYGMLMNAGCLILPCFRQDTPLLQPATLSSLNGFASIWCCIENMLNAAAAEGIFGVTRIPFDEERRMTKEALHIPENFEFPCFLALGYPASAAQRAPQVSIAVEERVHLNGWS